VYYQPRGSQAKVNGGSGLKAFPAGLRMISGNPLLRSKKYVVLSSEANLITDRVFSRYQAGLGTQAELAERAVQFSCLRYTANQTGYDGESIRILPSF
jgi:hypothetical protein